MLVRTITGIWTGYIAGSSIAGGVAVCGLRIASLDAGRALAQRRALFRNRTPALIVGRACGWRPRPPVPLREERVLEDPLTVENPAQPVGEQAGLEDPPQAWTPAPHGFHRYSWAVGPY